MRSVTCVRLGMIVALAVPLACRPASKKPAAAPQEPPAVPDVDLASFDPVVQDQIREARLAWEAASEDGGANGRLGMIYHAYGLTEAAEACYRRATHFAPDDYRWWHLLGQIQASTGETAAAVQSLERAYKAKQDYVATPLLLGDLAMKGDDVAGAKKWFDRALAIGPEVPQALVGVGQVRMKEGDLDAAIQQFTKAVHLAPTFAAAHYALGLAYRAKGEMEKAAAQLAKHQQVSTLIPPPPPDPLLREVSGLRRDADYLIKGANQCLKQKRYVEALRLYRTAQQRDPDRLMVEYNIGLALELSGKLEAAVKQLEKVVAKWPDFLEAHNSLGTCLRRIKRPEAAAERFRKILEIDPDYAKAYFNLASLASERADRAAAITMYKEGLKRKPGDFFGQLDLGTLYNRIGKAAEALPHLRAAVERRPNDVAAHYQLAQALRATKDVSEATIHYRRCLELAPAFSQASRNLSALLESQGDHAGAVKVLREHLSHVGDDWRSQLGLAWILATCPDDKIRDPEEAVRLAEPIYRGDGANDPVTLDTLAAAYAGVERLDDAVRVASLAVQLVAQMAPSAKNERMMKAMRTRLQGYQERQSRHAK